MMVNIEQIKQDRKNGVIISNLTWDALVAYASELEAKMPCSQKEWAAGRSAAKTCERCKLGPCKC